MRVLWGLFSNTLLVVWGAQSRMRRQHKHFLLRHQHTDKLLRSHQTKVMHDGFTNAICAKRTQEVNIPVYKRPKLDILSRSDTVVNTHAHTMCHNSHYFVVNRVIYDFAAKHCNGVSSYKQQQKVATTVPKCVLHSVSQLV